MDALLPAPAAPGQSQPIQITGYVPGRTLHAGVLEDVEEARLAGIERTVSPIRVGHASAHVAGPDLVEMAIGPAHGGLEHQVQAIKPDGQRHLNTAHYCGLDVIE